LTEERVARAGTEAALREERERAAETLATIAAARDDMTAHFKAIASDALETNRQRMSEQQEGGLAQLLKPLGEKLGAFEQTVRSTYDNEAQQRSALRQEVLNLREATTRINEDAVNLTRALKGEAKTRGNWGEVVLERVLERSGLTRGIEYQVQLALRDAHGALSRPDVVVRLPDAKHIVIDSKVSLVAYDRYHAATDDATRDEAGRAHVRAVREHVRALSEKDYQSNDALDSPDFIALFMPIESAYSLASSLDETLFMDAWERKVVIATPSTLLALMTTVHSLWQRDKQTRNAIAIAEQSGALHDQFVRVIESLHEVGKKLDEAKDAFTLTRKRLVDGKGNLVGRIDRLRDLGAKTRKQIPAAFAQAAELDEERSAYLEGLAPEPEGEAPTTRGAVPLTLVPPPLDEGGTR
jgi:DNA recombination protein RmuC